MGFPSPFPDDSIVLSQDQIKQLLTTKQQDTIVFQSLKDDSSVAEVETILNTIVKLEFHFHAMVQDLQTLCHKEFIELDRAFQDL